MAEILFFQAKINQLFVIFLFASITQFRKRSEKNVYQFLERKNILKTTI